MKNQNILIKNIYYMLSYTFTILNASQYQKIAKEEFHNIHNLFAAILSKGIGQQIKQGLYREYQNETDELSLIRGKIDIIKSIQNKVARKSTISCEYDILSENNILNQILKTAMLLLLSHPNVKQERKNILKQEILFFANIDTISPNNIPWSSLPFQRNNQNYQMLIGLCRFIFEGMLCTTTSGEYKMASFIDEQRICYLYERFIFEYYHKEFPRLNVKSAKINWALDNDISIFLPIMQTDIMLDFGNKILIIDAKYYSHTTYLRYGKHKLYSHNLYQIFTYVKNKRLEESKEVAGMLLYAKTQEEIQPDNIYSMSGNQIHVKTLDLNLPFSEITKQLHHIVISYFGENIV